jgi:hypothetical protein
VSRVLESSAVLCHGAGSRDGIDGKDYVGSPEKRGNAPGDGHAHRQCIIMLLPARGEQIMARSDVRPPLDTGATCVNPQRLL